MKDSRKIYNSVTIGALHPFTSQHTKPDNDSSNLHKPKTPSFGNYTMGEAAEAYYFLAVLSSTHLKHRISKDPLELHKVDSLHIC